MVGAATGAGLRGGVFIDTIMDKIGDAGRGRPVYAAIGEVVVAALSPRGQLAGKLLPAIQDIASRTSAAGARLVVIGGAGSLRVAPGGPRVADGDSMPAFLIEEARQTAASVAWLEADAPEGLDWTFISPASPSVLAILARLRARTPSPATSLSSTATSRPPTSPRPLSMRSSSTSTTVTCRSTAEPRRSSTFRPLSMSAHRHEPAFRRGTGPAS